MRPSYKTNDPKGWCGDSSRGAAMGRPSTQWAPKDFSGKLVLRHVRLNGDYDCNGTYFGYVPDLHIYWYASDDGQIDAVVRASCRESAKSMIRQSYAKARFYR
jgi:hypothetical protein